MTSVNNFRSHQHPRATGENVKDNEDYKER